MCKLSYPHSVAGHFVDLAEIAREDAVNWRYPDLLPTVLAQWALESGWGGSTLSRRYKNYAGMKWRTALSPWATPVVYDAHDGQTKYCEFKTHTAFIEAFFARFDQINLYDGWDKAAEKGGDAFIAHIGPTWVGGDRLHGETYVKKIKAIRERYFDA